MPPRAILAAMLAVSCLGGNYTATKFALEGLPPYLLLSLRFGLIALALAPFACRLPRPNLRAMAILALLMLVAQLGLSFLALDLGLSVTSTLIAGQLGVPFACLMAAIVLKDYLGPWRSAGLMVAFAGVMLVAGTPNASEHWGAFALAVLSALAAAGANIYLKTIRPAPEPVALLFSTALIATPIFMAASLLFEHDHAQAMLTAPRESWLGLAYSVGAASLIGHRLLSTLMLRYPVTSVAPFSLLIPITGLASAHIAFGDPLTPQVLIGAALTLLGVAILILRRPQMADIPE